MAWHDEVNLDTGIITIPGARTKTGRELVLTLPPAALAILKSVPQREGYPFVFGAKLNKGFSAWSSAKLQLDHRVAKATGQPLPHWTLHDLRRTMRTELGRLGVPPHVAELCIGHVRKGIEGTYDRHTYADEMAAALQRWADFVTSLVGERSTVVPMSGAA